MRKINERYARERYDNDGLLTEFRLEIPEDFNFAYDIVDDIALAEPDRPALVWCNPEGEEHFFSFGDIKKWSDKTANYLKELGIKKGDRVLVILRRHYQFWFVAVALHKLGALLIPATFMLKEQDLEYRLKSAGVSCLICTDVGEIANVVDNVCEGTNDAPIRILVNGGGGGIGIDLAPLLHDVDGANSPVPANAPASAPTIDLNNAPADLRGAALSGDAGICALPAPRDSWHDFNLGVRAASEDFERVVTNAYEPLIMYFSSGTSGHPKMALHDSSYALGHMTTAKHWHNVVSDGGLHFTIADTGWGKSVWGKLYGQWIMEACVLTYDFDRFNPADILALIDKYRITTMCCPPTMYRMMMQADWTGYTLESLFHCTTAGEALNPDLYDFWLNKTGKKIFEGFGQTETPLTCCNTPKMTPRPGSLGKPLPMYHVELLDADGNKCAPGKTGEICVKIDLDANGHKPPAIMMEYFRDEERTAETIHDGWYHSGDTAWADEDGYLWYVGRNDDIIKSSGYRIGPTEIESVLLEHAAVFECAVTGVPDELRGFAVKATIVLSGEFTASDELTTELQSWVKEKTAPYKYPRIISYVDSLPKTVNGKIRRKEIREADEQ